MLKHRPDQLIPIMPSNINQKGISLIELLIGIVVGLLIIAGGLAMIVPMSKVTSETLQATKLNTELQTITHIIDSELRRAGFTVSPSAGNEKVQILDSGACIVYAYQEPDGTLANWAGFKFADQKISSTRDQTVQPADCDTGTWSAMTTTDNFIVNSLNFSCIGSKAVQVNLSAESGNGPNNFTKILTTLSQLRNTECVPAP